MCEEKLVKGNHCKSFCSIMINSNVLCWIEILIYDMPYLPCMPPAVLIFMNSERFSSLFVSD